MVHIVGAGSGAADLITLRGARLLEKADVVIYAGSLINKQLLGMCKSSAALYDSAYMTLDEVTDVIARAEADGLDTVRLHTGDPCLYGAVREQMNIMDSLGIAYDICPGVSSFCGAAAALRAEYTLPGVSQTVIITRAEGRTPVPEKESLSSLAAHNATMVIFLSASLTEKVQTDLIGGGYPPDTPAAIVYKATHPDERVYRCRLSDLAETARKYDITRTALICVGGFLGSDYELSKLYDKNFETMYRK